MPRYDLYCGACGHIWEEVQAMELRAPIRCPSCRGKKGRRKPSLFNCVTDTSLPREAVVAGRIAGYNIRSRSDLRRMEGDGIALTSRRDVDLANRKRGKAAFEPLDRVLAEESAPIRIESRPRKRRK